MTTPSQPARQSTGRSTGQSTGQPTRRPVRRVSRRRYMVRRLGALVVLALVVVGLVKVGGVLVGSDNTTDAAGPESTSLGDGQDLSTTSDGADPAPTATVADGTSGPSAETVPGTGADTVPATEPETTGPPTADNPATVLIAGDSDAGTFGPYLDSLLATTGIVQTQLDYKVSSGLSRPDFFDWPAHFRQSVPVSDPDIVVVTFGGNDPQGLSVVEGSTPQRPNFIVDQPTGEPGGDAEWRAEYGRRVGEVMDYLSAEGRTLVWVGIPNDDNPDVTARLAVQNEVVQAEVAKRPHVIFVDTWKRFSGRNGGWAEFVIDPRDGTGKDVRADDGFHLNVTGAEILALDIADAVKGALRARGASI